MKGFFFFFFFSSRRRHTRFSRDWSSDVCSSDLLPPAPVISAAVFAAASPLMSRATTCAPSRAKPSAMARPMPEPAPVMAAMWLSRRFGMLFVPPIRLRSVARIEARSAAIGSGLSTPFPHFAEPVLGLAEGKTGGVHAGHLPASLIVREHTDAANSLSVRPNFPCAKRLLCTRHNGQAANGGPHVPRSDHHPRRDPPRSAAADQRRRPRAPRLVKRTFPRRQRHARRPSRPGRFAVALSRTFRQRSIHEQAAITRDQVAAACYHPLSVIERCGGRQHAQTIPS